MFWRWVVWGAYATGDPPVATGTLLVVDEDETGFGESTAVDVDGDALTWLLYAPPAYGEAIVDGASGALTYVPDPDYHGDDSFQVIADDGVVSSAAATVLVTVLPTNDAPSLSDLSLVTWPLCEQLHRTAICLS